MMANNLFPTGQIFQFEGDPLLAGGQDKLWFGDATVSTKKDLYAPYLQVHHKTEAGWRTIAPNGTFNMVINAPEYFNALKDYNIIVDTGYIFDTQTDIFCSFVTDMYNLRKQFHKNDPMRRSRLNC